MPDSAMKSFATEVVQRLRDAGHTSLFAGGCVRDSLLGLAPKDFDVATNARPEEVRKIFGRHRTIPVGQSFGVITVLGPRPHQVEVATFRSDGEYSDGRHPDEVTFSSPEEDALRRDFTVNGMFFDPLKQEVIDYVGGQQDLAAGIIRAIGSPQQRIEEDHLRMLRAIRFAATYSFQIESGTLDAVRDHHQQIDTVSQERVTQELERMLRHNNRGRSLDLLKESLLLAHVLPVVDVVADDEPRWRRLLAIADMLADVRWSTVLALLIGPEGADITDVSRECRRLKVSNEVRSSVEWLSRHLQRLKHADRMRFSELQPLLINTEIDQALLVLDGVATVDGDSKAHLERCRELLQLEPELLDPEPLIRGEDLVAAGIAPGPAFSKLIKLVRDAQLDGQIDSKAQALDLIRQQQGES